MPWAFREYPIRRAGLEAGLALLCVISLCSCATYTRTISSEPPGALIYSGPAAGAMGTAGLVTPYVFSGRGWQPWCFAATKPGYSTSPVECLPGGYSNQFVTLTLGVLPQRQSRAGAHHGLKVQWHHRNRCQRLRAKPGGLVGNVLGALLRGYFTAIGSPRLGEYDGAVVREDWRYSGSQRKSSCQSKATTQSLERLNSRRNR